MNWKDCLSKTDWMLNYVIKYLIFGHINSPKRLLRVQRIHGKIDSDNNLHR